ncbi:MAG: class I SAM-dependent rRNA methyltransferase, partial [Thermotogaceae bacterium]|nr:class I SAM-dependent rRNA methyltransferase [Thermotogaceae bacterium]
MARVFLRERISNRIKKGHPWIYDNEVGKVEGEFEDGDIVGVFRYDRTFLGRGFINEKSKIRVRLLTRRNEKIDEDFFRKKIE